MPIPHLQLQVTAAISHNLKNNLPSRYNSLFLHGIKSLLREQANIVFQISLSLSSQNYSVNKQYNRKALKLGQQQSKCILSQFFKMHDLGQFNPSVPQISCLYLKITYPSSHQRSAVRIKLYNEVQKLAFYLTTTKTKPRWQLQIPGKTKSYFKYKANSKQLIENINDPCYLILGTFPPWEAQVQGKIYIASGRLDGSVSQVFDFSIVRLLTQQEVGLSLSLSLCHSSCSCCLSLK